MGAPRRTPWPTIISSEWAQVSTAELGGAPPARAGHIQATYECKTMAGPQHPHGRKRAQTCAQTLEKALTERGLGTTIDLRDGDPRGGRRPRSAGFLWSQHRRCVALRLLRQPHPGGGVANDQLRIHCLHQGLPEEPKRVLRHPGRAALPLNIRKEPTKMMTMGEDETG
jgi:hypothetical protein